METTYSVNDTYWLLTTTYDDKNWLHLLVTGLKLCKYHKNREEGEEEEEEKSGLNLSTYSLINSRCT